MAIHNNTRFLTTIKKSGAGKDRERKLSIILLNGTPGYRMKSKGPKCLLKIDNNVTVIDNQVEILKACYPNSEIIVTVGFDADKIIKKNVKHVRYVENQLFETTNIVEEIRLGLNNCETEDIMIIYGDVVFDTNSIDNITKNGSCIVCASKTNMDKDDIGATIIDGKLTQLSYGLEPKWGHIVYLTGNELGVFRNLCNDREKVMCYPFELINMTLDRASTKIKAVHAINSEIMKIESIKDIK